jgi:hypothetical protein
LLQWARACHAAGMLLRLPEELLECRFQRFEIPADAAAG